MAEGRGSVKPVFNYDSLRSQKARFTRHLGGVWRTINYLLLASAVIIGILLLIGGYSIGWFVASLAGPLLMIAIWWQGDLLTMDIRQPADTMDDILSASVLGRLPRNPSPKQIAEIIGQIRAGQFMATRFGISANFLLNIASDNEADTEAVWRSAINIWERTGSPKVTGAVLAVALIERAPGSDGLLASLRLGMEDVDRGIKWYERIKLLAEESATSSLRTGGIARDWSFGYTPLLSKFAKNVSSSVIGGTIMSKTDVHEENVNRLISVFSSNGRQNITLVGPDGVGKSTIVSVFAEMLIDGYKHVPSNLLYQQVYMLDATALISVANGRGELEGLVTQILNEAYLAKNIILCLDNAQVFFEEGLGSVDLSTVLTPILEAGRLKIILTMDEQRFLQISQRKPQLAHTLNTLNISPTDELETYDIMRDQLVYLEFQHKVTYMYQALTEAYRIGNRYVQDLAMPGRALKVMEMSAGYANDGLVTAQSVHDAVEKTMNLKISSPDTSEEKDKLLNLEDLIHQRMINQTRAVSVVSDAIRRARAGVRNQNRPVGAFLFLGPTGVGKTELAKALAEVYYQGEENLIRLNLNEFNLAEDTSRLLADGADDPLSLTAQISKQPFSVVLFDEIEKAHPQVLATLLQLLDEGVLTDSSGRAVSFRDAIIIATTNAGAERISEYISRGYQLEQFEATFTDELLKANLFAPEFINRFDEIVVFKPLGKAELLQVVDLILKGVNKTLELQQIQVAVEPDGRELLVEAGYDPRLGARPLRRVVQRSVENVIAKQLLSGTIAPGSTTIVTAAQIREAVGGPELVPPS